MSRKVYKVVYFDDVWEMKVEIEEGLETEKKMLGMVRFWADWKDRLERTEGNVTHAFLKMLARELIGDSMDSIFPWKKLATREGWLPVDGTHGIKVLTCDQWDFDEDDFVVREDPAGKEGDEA